MDRFLTLEYRFLRPQTLQRRMQGQLPFPPATLLEEVELEFSDLVKLACLLCARQFKKHKEELDLHQVFSPRLRARPVLTETSEILKTRIYETSLGERPRPLRPLQRRTAPKLPHQNIVIGPRNDASTNRTFHYSKDWRISPSRGVLQRVQLGPQYHHHRCL
jgi:hypothetical protein